MGWLRERGRDVHIGAEGERAIYFPYNERASLHSANFARVGGVAGLRGGGDWGGCAREGGMCT